MFRTGRPEPRLQFNSEDGSGLDCWLLSFSIHCYLLPQQYNENIFHCGQEDNENIFHVSAPGVCLTINISRWSNTSFPRLQALRALHSQGCSCYPCYLVLRVPLRDPRKVLPPASISVRSFYSWLIISVPVSPARHAAWCDTSLPSGPGSAVVSDWPSLCGNECPCFLPKSKQILLGVHALERHGGTLSCALFPHSLVFLPKCSPHNLLIQASSCF